MHSTWGPIIKTNAPVFKYSQYEVLRAAITEYFAEWQRWNVGKWKMLRTCLCRENIDIYFWRIEYLFWSPIPRNNAYNDRSWENIFSSVQCLLVTNISTTKSSILALGEQQPIQHWYQNCWFHRYVCARWDSIKSKKHIWTLSAHQLQCEHECQEHKQTHNHQTNILYIYNIYLPN